MPEEPQLVAYCFIAMATVGTLLGIMALIIWGIMALFPGQAAPPRVPRRKKAGSASPSQQSSQHLDPALVAAISSAAAQSNPSMVVTHIQELK